MSPTHRLLRIFRSLHLYLGVFSAPALMFFAITGGLQTFSLHETTRGSGYAPPAWLATMAQLHKKQTTVMPVRRAGPPRSQPVGIAESSPAMPMSTGVLDLPGTPSAAPEQRATPPRKNLLPMKIFFALIALSLLISTLTGLYMAYRYSRKPKLFGGILLAGILLPVVLTLI